MLDRRRPPAPGRHGDDVFRHVEMAPMKRSSRLNIRRDSDFLYQDSRAPPKRFLLILKIEARRRAQDFIINRPRLSRRFPLTSVGTQGVLMSMADLMLMHPAHGTLKGVRCGLHLRRPYWEKSIDSYRLFQNNF